VRRLSPQFTTEDFTALMAAVAAEAGFEERQGAWTILYYAPGKLSKKRGKVTGAGYLTVDRDASVEPATIVDRIAAAVHSVAAVFDSHDRGDPTGPRPLVELAPYQRVFRAKARRDNFDGTYDKDPEYKAFCEALAAPVEKLPSADVQLDQREAEGIVAPKPTSALVEFLRERRALRSRPLRPTSFSDVRGSSAHKQPHMLSSGPPVRVLPPSSRSSTSSSREERHREHREQRASVKAAGASSSSVGSGGGGGSSSRSEAAPLRDREGDGAREKLRAKRRAKSKAQLSEQQQQQPQQQQHQHQHQHRSESSSSSHRPPPHRGSSDASSGAAAAAVAAVQTPAADRGSGSGRSGSVSSGSSAARHSAAAAAAQSLPSPPQQQQQQSAARSSGSHGRASSWSEAAGAPAVPAPPAAAPASEKG
jgi:Smg-4/UPF3 family